MAEIAANEADGKPLEIWFADEARIGQKNKITRRWAKRGTRPSAPKDQRTASAYIFGAICPAEGKGAGLVLPRCTTAGMSLHFGLVLQRQAVGLMEAVVGQALGHEEPTHEHIAARRRERHLLLRQHRRRGGFAGERHGQTAGS